jgi:Fe-S cluster assembly protein SufD
MTDLSGRESVSTMTEEKREGFPPDAGEPKWLKQERVSAWELYLRTPMPTGHDEDWRRTAIDSLDLSTLRKPSSHLERVEQADMPDWLLHGLENFGALSGALGISGSKLWVQPVPEALRRQGVVFCDLKTAWARHGDLVQKYFASDSPNGASATFQNKFALFNRALFNRSMFLYVPENVTVEHPFFGFVAAEEEAGFTSVPRILVVAAPHSKVQFVQAFLSHSGVKEIKQKRIAEQNHPWSLSNALIEIYIGEGASLDYVEVQSFDENTFAIGETHSVISRDGKFSALTVALGGGQVKSEIITSLQERGAASKITGLVLGDRSERFSFNTVQEHNAPDGVSDINFRVALKGAASSIYQGIIKVAKIAQRTDAFQTNKNLLLGAEARADSIPRLEILADDVKCSHGATVGPVDKEQVFYLMSRGLDYSEAEELVVNGFFVTVIEACPVHGVSDWIGELVRDKIASNRETSIHGGAGDPGK